MCVETRKMIPDATYIQCDDYLDDVDDFLDFLWGLPNANHAKTFPMIFKDGSYIGGIKELTNSFRMDVSF